MGLEDSTELVVHLVVNSLLGGSCCLLCYLVVEEDYCNSSVGEAGYCSNLGAEENRLWVLAGG